MPSSSSRSTSATAAVLWVVGCLMIAFSTTTHTTAHAFVPTRVHIRPQSTVSSSSSSSSLHVLKDVRSIRIVGANHNGASENEEEDDDDDENLVASSTNNGAWPLRGLSFSELLWQQQLPSASNGQPKNGHNGHTATNPSTARFVAETDLPTALGHFRMRAYAVDDHPVLEPCVIYATDKPLVSSSLSTNDPIPIRIHDQCLTSEVFGSLRCDCSEQLLLSLQYIQQHGGCIIYLQQEGRGIGLANKIAAYALQDVGLDTVDANVHLGFPEDCREYTMIPSILQDLGLMTTTTTTSSSSSSSSSKSPQQSSRPITLLTNNPRKVQHLEALGISVAGTTPLVVPATTPHNYQYMATKVERMQHANLAPLLLNTRPLVNGTEKSPSALRTNGHMVPLVQTDDEKTATSADDGIEAAEDGYCLGRQSVVDAIAAMARGELIVVVDDLDRENEGDFIMAADLSTPQTMGQIVKYSSGVVCVALEGSRLDALDLPAMVSHNEDPKGTAFTVTVDAAHGVSTGISATDRAHTMRVLADPATRPSDLHRPGHVLPLRARPGGVLTRNGHTEAAVDLAKLAGRAPAGVLCELVSEDDPAEMMRLPEIRRFCARQGYVLTSIADLQQYRRETGL